MKNLLNRKARIISTVACILLLSIPLHAQQLDMLVRGIVCDSASWGALPFVNVKIKHTLRGTVTDSKGGFVIGASRSDTLVLSYVGYNTKEIALWNWEEGIIPMSESSTSLKGIIITGKRFDESYYRYLFSDRVKAKSYSSRLPLYYRRDKKESIKLRRFREYEELTSVYNELLVKSDSTRLDLMKRFSVTEQEYNNYLQEFNSKNQDFMFYLSSPELLSLLYNFFQTKTAMNR